MYRVTQQISDLGKVDFDFDCSAALWILLMLFRWDKDTMGKAAVGKIIGTFKATNPGPRPAG